MTTTTIPMELPSLANTRGHWSKKARLVKSHRDLARLIVPWHPTPCTVTLTRIAPRALDDDNLVAAFKGIRDGIADKFGIDDRDPRVVWKYAQERGRPKERAIRVTVEALAAVGAL